MSSSQKHPPQAVVRHRHRHNLRNRFELVKTLGQGTYGKVKLAVEKSSGKRVSILSTCVKTKFCVRLLSKENAPIAQSRTFVVSIKVSSHKSSCMVIQVQHKVCSSIGPEKGEVLTLKNRCSLLA